MGTLVSRVLQMIREADTTVMLLHHLGHNGKQGRGHSVVLDNLSTEIRLAKEGKRRINVYCSKQKDHPHFEPFAFRLEDEGASAVLRPAVGKPNPLPEDDDADTAMDGAEIAAERVSEVPRVKLPAELVQDHSGRFKYEGEPLVLKLATLYLSNPDRVYSQTQALTSAGLKNERGGGWANGRAAWKVLRDEKWIHDYGTGYRWHAER